ncbi:uridine diphosphate-N-acetylglucosamine-binding protein YvcK [Catenovulum sp. SM1970]|uniref:gluconeogenesis factor YvcK family protein n=1 Tax=Marinifaba aquimaris TaxID=2741323 RepID=UPI00157235A2|nr:uridine diphosphate-N-acetylglucosamine-binding protein YvcK [Marinifaba aquimaris]NTS77865.1 uridine diphosphate-N-acetylglucosamine-binding protein YvcK [Marinifaba aquimaris]
MNALKEWQINMVFHKEINLVALGGGHGLGKVLNTFADFGPKLTGIVATTDNGGSTGKLRDAFDCIAWGDLRNCLTHLAGKDSLGAKLLEYRFGDAELKGHSIGNLVFYALEQLDFSPVEVIELTRRMLKVESRLYPMSEQPTHLRSIYPDGNIILGETNVDASHLPVPESIELTDPVTAPTRVLRAIQQADFIILSPGSFFTSLLPALLMTDITQALIQSQAKVILIDNLVAEIGPASQLNLNDKINWLKKHHPQMKVDAVLTQHSEKLEDHSIYQLVTELSEPEPKHYHHNEQKLRLAMEEVFTHLV